MWGWLGRWEAWESSTKPRHDDVRGRDQVLELGHQALPVAVQGGRRRDVVAPLDQEAHHPALVLQPWDVAPDTDAVHRGAAEADVLGQ
jgi:hypothetical protein